MSENEKRLGVSSTCNIGRTYITSKKESRVTNLGSDCRMPDPRLSKKRKIHGIPGDIIMY